MRFTASVARTAIVVAVALMASGCGDQVDTATAGVDGSVTELRYQGSANNVTLPELAEDLGYLGNIRLNWVGNTSSGPQDIQSAATGQTDFGGAFSGAVVKLIEAGAPVKAVVNYYGVDQKTFTGFYVKAGSSIHRARDLIGKKVAVNTLGAHSEAVIDTWLKKNGLSSDEIKQVQLVVLPPNDTEEAIRRGQVDAGALGGVLQDNAVASGGLRSLFSDYQLFGAFAAGQYVFRTDFTEKNPAAVRALTTGVAKAIEWENKTPREQVIKRFAAIIEKRHRGENTSNLRYWKSSGITRGGLVSDDDFSRWDTWLEDAGILTSPVNPSKYYTNQFNDLSKG